MSYQTRNLTRLRKQRLVILLSLAALTGTLLVYGAAPAHAQEPAPQPPPGDCWNGALSGDPLHCYILEEAQRAGEIEVDAVYLAPGGGPLYIFLRQDEPIDEQVSSFFKEKTYEYLGSAEGKRRYDTWKCEGHKGDQRKSCLDGILWMTRWQGFGHPRSRALPPSNVYESITLYVGGAESRKTELGWASWRQVWPAVAGTVDGAEGFDVSDVDVTNFPELDCVKEAPRFTRGGTAACLAWKEHGSGIAGWRFSHPKGSPLYIQVKSPPADEDALEALKGQLVPPHLKANYEAGKFKVVIIPVKYDFGELWRWSVILDRFAVSAGNTVGITAGRVVLNVPEMFAGPGREPVVWLNDEVEPARLNDSRSALDWATVRDVVQVWAFDPDLAAPALPELLPKLGIPLDAVAFVGHDSAAPIIIETSEGRAVGSDSINSASDSPAQGSVRRDEDSAVQTSGGGSELAPNVASGGGSVVSAPSPAPADTSRVEGPKAIEPSEGQDPTGRRVSMWVIAGGGGAVAIAFLVAVIALTARLRRRRA